MDSCQVSESGVGLAGGPRARGSSWSTPSATRTFGTRRLLGGVGQPRADADREALGRLSRALGREPQAYHRRVGWRGEPSAFRPPGAGSSFSRSQGSRHAGLERFTFAGMLLVRGAVCLPPRKWPWWWRMWNKRWSST